LLGSRFTTVQALPFLKATRIAFRTELSSRQRTTRVPVGSSSVRSRLVFGFPLAVPGIVPPAFLPSCATELQAITKSCGEPATPTSLASPVASV
jgi:hypothetical protein